MKHLCALMAVVVGNWCGVLEAVGEDGKKGEAAVKLFVTNRSSTPVSMFWIAEDGAPTPYGTIDPTPVGGQPFVQETYAGHSWQFRVGRQVVKSYVATREPVQQVVVGNLAATGNAPTAPVREPFDVSTGNGLVIQRQRPMPRDIDPGLVTTDAPTAPIREPADVSTGNGLVIQRQRPMPRNIDVGVVVPPSPAAPTNSGNPNPASVTHPDPLVAAFLQVHNDARAEVGVGPLQWSDKLAQAAQQWADQLTALGQLMHNPQTPYGENLAARSGAFSPAGAAQLWLGEKADFRPGQLGSGKAGHYTQMVWRGTRHVGYGVAKVKGMTVVVANYDPPGNYANQPPY